MNKFTEFICKHKTIILVITLLLLIPSLIGIKATKINYDILVYLPKDIETIKGENILTDDFNMGAFSISIIDNMEAKDVLKLEQKIKKIKSVNEVKSLYDVVGTTIPLDMLPDEVTSRLAKGDSTLLLITFKDGTSEETTLNAVEEIRKLTKDDVKVAGMSAMVLDTMNLSNEEITAYIMIAVSLCLIVLLLALDSYLVPFLLLINIGIAILFNMGTNIFLGNISYITKAISAVLQLGVTTDFSIFLYHKYESCKKKSKTKEEAMKKAIKETITAVTGSSLTTIAGFLALCFMTLTLGKDIGIVMAKGVLFGVICVITVFPALLLVFDKAITKTTHKVLLPKFTHIKNFTTNHYKLIFIIFLILLIPATIGQSKTNVYYNLDRTLPSNLPSSIANSTLKKDYKIVSPEMILVDKNLSNNDINDLTNEIKNIKGIDFALSYANISELGIPLDQFDSNLTKMLESDKYKLIILNSKYDIATTKLNNQITEINKIVKKYDKHAIVAGEGPLMKDLVEISDTDFKNVNYSSIAIILIIMFFVLKSPTLPVLLIAVIEFAIFTNMAVPYYTNTSIPFIASIVIGTIQLGATIDYAILMTTKYIEERKTKDKMSAIKITLDNSINSIFVSGMCFFAATFGVGVYSKLEMIGSLCTLISRGAIISMLSVVMILPAILIIFDKLICKSTKGLTKGEKNMKNKKNIKLASTIILLSILALPFNTYAMTKDETVYAKLNQNGTVKKVSVTEHLINDEKNETLNDLTNLSNIKNLNGNEKFTLNNNLLTWENKKKKDIYYEGTTTNNLPVTVNVTYKLNGEVKTYKEMKNKKGNVEIILSFTNNEKHTVNGKTVYTPFVGMFTTTLNTKNNSNIEVSTGKVISTGTNNVITAISAPGLSESFDLDGLKDLDTITIKYNTTKFNLNSMYLALTPKLLEDSDLNKLDNLDTVLDKVNSIEDASKTLASGTNSLKEGLIKAAEGAKDLNDGITKTYEGTTALKNALEKSISDLDNDQSNALDESTLNTIVEKAATSATLTDEQKNNIATKALLTLKNSSKYQEINKKYEAGLNSVSALGITDTIITDCATNNINETNQSICQNENLTSLISAKQMLLLMEEVTKQTAVNTASLTAEETARKVSSSVATIVGNETKKIATEKTKQALTLLYQNINTLNQGLNTIQTGSTELYNGSNTLKEGAITLDTGMNTFNNEVIAKIANLVNNTLKDKADTVKALKKLSNDYKSYTMIDENTKGTTKFIYLINNAK